MVSFGFPDIIFEPENAFGSLLDKKGSSGADLVLRLFPATEPKSVDIVDFDSYGRVREIKPSVTDLPYTWVIALWTPVFMDFMHEYVIDAKKEIKGSRNDSYQPKVRESTMGEVIRVALSRGLLIESVAFTDHSCFDIGTPENLVKAHGNNVKSLLGKKC